MKLLCAISSLQHKVSNHDNEVYGDDVNKTVSHDDGLHDQDNDAITTDSNENNHQINDNQNDDNNLFSAAQGNYIFIYIHLYFRDHESL
jgi:hypothetical protein